MNLRNDEAWMMCQLCFTIIHSLKRNEWKVLPRGRIECWLWFNMGRWSDVGVACWNSKVHSGVDIGVIMHLSINQRNLFRWLSLGVMCWTAITYEHESQVKHNIKDLQDRAYSPTQVRRKCPKPTLTVRESNEVVSRSLVREGNTHTFRPHYVLKH